MTRTSSRTFSLLAAATVVSGWLAGAALERAAVGMRVWLTMGVESWASFDHGAASGFVIDGFLGVAATVLIIAAAVSATLDRDRDRATPGPLIVAAVFSVLGLLFTAKAMSLVQLLAASPPTPDLPPIFQAYLIWGVDFRAAVAAVAFVAVVWALFDLSVAAPAERSAVVEAPAE